MKKFYILFSTVFRIGYFPFAPGTIGTLFAASLYLILPLDFKSINFTEAFFLIFFAGLSIPIITRTEDYLSHDDKRIVIDEVFGYIVAVLFFDKTLLIIILGFVFFRIFDILKPEPVDVLQKLPGGFGVLLDDIMAGIYANISIRIVFLVMDKIIMNIK